MAFGTTADPSGVYLDVDGTALYYVEAGEGRPVLIVPGWTMTHRFFARQLDYFERSRAARAIVVDPRAHGRSAKTFEGASYARHAMDLRGLMQALDLQDVVLLGWSWGGAAVYAYLDRFGTEGVAGVVLIDQTPTPLASAHTIWSEGGPEEAKRLFDAFNANRIGTVRAFIAPMFAKGVRDKDARWMLAETMLTPAIVASQLLYDGWLGDWTAAFARVDVPVLHIVREEQGPAARRFLARHKPDAEIVVLGGHAMFWDHAEAFNAALAAFLARLG
jgi:non-heme chloroperoxidase